MVENEAWHAPLRYATSAVSRGPTSPPFSTVGGSGAWYTRPHSMHSYANARCSVISIGSARSSTCWTTRASCFASIEEELLSSLGVRDLGEQ